ncbi:hypothetical protein F4677DRAFT_454993 [Hypoxylon crocopeplum]|nr:hypothetical protein F4677DRAFT_454993 [Hypoxylon crocopeplum]
MSRPTPSPAAQSSSISLGQDDKNPTIQFTNVQDLFQAMNYISRDILTMYLLAIFPRSKQGAICGRRIRFRRYCANSHILIIIIPTSLYESLHLQLYKQYNNNHPRGDSGEGDSAGGPNPERLGPGKWPTLVIEAGDSESLNQLRVDMRWWFSMSNHDVKIIILAKFNHRQREEEEAATIRSEATTTGRAAALRPVLRQTITISRLQESNLVSYNVTNGALVLDFRLLFLRDPGPQEGDLIITIPTLQRYTELVWAQVQD